MKVIAKICELPVQFKSRGNVSLIRLVDESGYRSEPNALTVEAVSAHLLEHPDLIEVWLGYSRDKRSSGWYIVQLPAGPFEVGSYPAGERISIADGASACAEFIVREVRSVGASG